MTSSDVYFDAHATQLELSFRSDVWRAFTYLHFWDKAFLDKKRVFVQALNINALLFECTVFFRHVMLIFSFTFHKGFSELGEGRKVI